VVARDREHLSKHCLSVRLPVVVRRSHRSVPRFDAACDVALAGMLVALL
jgi:hypothetical protein